MSVSRDTGIKPRLERMGVNILLVAGLLVLLLVNREFGLADNGDYSRYIMPFASKPAALAENWPEAGTPEHQRRFFQEPIFYWSAAESSDNRAWFTSTQIFWRFGNFLGRTFYSSDVVNLRFSSLPFFLLHAVLFAFVLLSLRGTPGSLAPAFLVFLLFVDTRITSFYNSYYAESLPLIAILALFTVIVSASLSTTGDRGCTRSQNLFRVAGFLTFALLIAAALSKRQYLYFVLPALVLCWHLLAGNTSISRKQRSLLFALISATALGVIALTTLKGRVDNPDEAGAARITSFHALYFGVLPHANDRADALRTLGLPAESAHLIGHHAWSPEAYEFIHQTPEVNLRTFLRAIFIDPRSMLRSVAHNARQIGNLNLDMNGTVPGMFSGAPPPITRSMSAVFASIGGFATLLVAFAALTYSVYVSMRHGSDRSWALLGALLFCITCLDVGISIFDGQADARKHVAVASVCCYALVVLAVLSFFRSNRLKNL